MTIFLAWGWGWSLSLKCCVSWTYFWHMVVDIVLEVNNSKSLFLIYLGYWIKSVLLPLTFSFSVSCQIFLYFPIIWPNHFVVGQHVVHPSPPHFWCPSWCQFCKHPIYGQTIIVISLVTLLATTFGIMLCVLTGLYSWPLHYESNCTLIVCMCSVIVHIVMLHVLT